MNIQQTIIEVLRQQLYHHQYIVLPGFGGFVLKPRPAHFSASGLQLLPPSKTVSFNSQLRQNDGILSAWLQKKIGCTAEVAFVHLGDFADYCRSVLENKRRLSLPGIGFFHLDFENNTCFEPQADHNFLADSFGLTAVNLSHAPQQEPAPRRKPVFEDRLVTSVEAKRGVAARTREAVMPLMLVGVISLLLLLLVSVSNFKGELRAALSGSDSKGAYMPVSYPPLDIVKPEPARPLVSDAQGIARLDIGSAEIAVNVLRADNPSGNTSTEMREGYEIVVGCFSVPSNARKLVRQLKRKNMDVHISRRMHKGMVIVSYGSYSDRESALLQLPSVKQVIPNAWIKNK